MAAGVCRCGGGEEMQGCPTCGGVTVAAYWCETCRKAIVTKRCPQCGLKAKKVKG